MDLQVRKHRMVRWLREFLSIVGAALIITTPSAQAVCLAEYKTVGGTQSVEAKYFYWSDYKWSATVTVPANLTVCMPINDAVNDVAKKAINITFKGAVFSSAIFQIFPPYMLDFPFIQDARVVSDIPIYGYDSYLNIIVSDPAYRSATFNFPLIYNYKKYSISLQGGSEVEPSKGSDLKTLPFIATVIDKNTNQPPTTPVTVKISLKVDSKSGGHEHGDSNRPRGGIAELENCPSDDTCWSWTSPANNGMVVFNFNAPEASGKYTITATCDGCSNTETAPVDVRVKESKDPGWDHLTVSPTDYALVGGETGKKHTDNHYLTATASNNLKRLVKAYNLAYPAGPVLRLNDASLEWGGKFDISGNWAGDHKNHRKGVVIDIRANQDPTAIPQVRFDDFEKLAKKSGAYADLHCAFSGPYVCPACLLDTGSNRHYHVRLLGQGIDK